MSDILKKKIIAKKQKLDEIEKLKNDSPNHANSRNNLNIQYEGQNSSISFKNKSFFKENSPKIIKKDKWVRITINN